MDTLSPLPEISAGGYSPTGSPEGGFLPQVGDETKIFDLQDGAAMGACVVDAAVAELHGVRVSSQLTGTSSATFN